MDEFMKENAVSLTEAEREMELELELELTEDPVWAEFGEILSAAHLAVYAGPVSGSAGTSAKEEKTVFPECVHEISKIQGGRRSSWRPWAFVSLAVLAFTAVFLGSRYRVDVRNNSGVQLTQETFSDLERNVDPEFASGDGPAFEPALDPDSESVEAADEFAWESGEWELADFDQLIEQVGRSEAPLDWEIAILGNSLRELTEETEDEDWF